MIMALWCYCINRRPYLHVTDSDHAITVYIENGNRFIAVPAAYPSHPTLGVRESRLTKDNSSSKQQVMLYDLKSRCDGEHERSIYSVLDKLQNRTEQ